MKLYVFGPNLNSAAQRKGQFHVHAADCGDCKHYGPGTKFGGESESHAYDFETLLDVSEFLNCDILSDYGLTPEDEEGKELLEEWLNDLYVAPCVKLPVKS